MFDHKCNYNARMSRLCPPNVHFLRFLSLFLLCDSSLLVTALYLSAIYRAVARKVARKQHSVRKQSQLAGL